MIIKSAFCQSLIEGELQDLSSVAFTLHGDNRPTDQDLSLNPINIYWHSEPDEYFGNHSWIRANAHKFDAVLTWNTSDIPNAIFCPFGTSAFHDRVPPDKMIRKETQVSFIRGNKHHNVPGHDLRWELWNRRDEIKFPKDFYSITTPEYARNEEEDRQWFEQRTNIFQDSLFHIAIENTSHDNYFTEKIMDCFLFRTVPIYYGCPNINDFFDSRGIITFDTINELIVICNNLTYDDYINGFEGIDNNLTTCKQYLNLGKTIHDRLQTFFKFNGLI